MNNTALRIENGMSSFELLQAKVSSLEATEKLNRIQPANIGQASRISGVSPADVSVLIIWLSSQRKSD